jgi:hypothetical protein
MLAATGMRVRLLCAPAGSGTTTALLEYERINEGVAYVVPPKRSGPTEIAAILRSCKGAREVVVDGADRIASAGFDALLKFASTEGAPRLLLAGRERSALRVHVLVARGEAELIDASILAFDEDEILRLANNHGVAVNPDDPTQLLHDTEGWAIAVSWIVRDAARERRSLCGAFDIWIEAHGYLLREFIDSGIHEGAETECLDTVLAADSYAHVQRELLRLEGLGYPIARTRSGLRPYRVLRRVAHPSSQIAPGERNRCLTLTLFGRFSCRVGDRDVAFVRRRDRNVLIYLALAPNGRVPRADLARTFWPDVPAAIAAQGVRTTLCRLRRAIAAAADTDADLYLRSGAVVALDFENVAVDARRFSEHAERGRVADERDETDNAHRHYKFAERVYAGDLLRSEPIDPALEPLVQQYTELAQHVSERIRVLPPLPGAAIERRALLQPPRRRAHVTTFA